MKLLKMLLLAAAMFVATGCEEQFKFNEDTLAQTIWKGHYKSYNAIGDSALEWYDFTVQFTTDSTGKYIDRESNVSYFEYDIEDHPRACRCRGGMDRQRLCRSFGRYR